MLSAGVFVFAISRALIGQRPDTVPVVHGVLLPLPIRDTSDRFFGSQQLPRSVGASVGVIDSAMIATSFARTLSELLAARVPGVSVMRSSGIVGGGSRVRLRGATGIYATREPIVMVDGVRVDATQNAPGLSIGGQQPSRLDDIQVDQIARIEVLRGPAASALYGTNGAGGVIRITTRAPSRTHQTSWSTYAEGGIATDITSYPANYSTGSGITGEPTCTRADASLGTCAAGPLLSWNPLENASPFRTATSVKVGTSLSGGIGGIGYIVSGVAGHEQGVLEPNDATRYALRLNADARPARSLDLALSTSYTHSQTTLPLGDQARGTLYAGLLGNAIDDPMNRGYRSDVLAFADVPTDQRVGRATASFTATWRATSWLTGRALAGGETVQRDDARTTQVQSGASPPSTVTRVEESTGRDRSATLGANATASFDLARSLETETTLGIEWLGASRRSTDSSAASVLKAYTKPRATGLIASERLAWLDRRFIGVGVRRDQATIPELVTTTFAPTTFVSADAAWVLGDEPFFPQVEWLSHMRLRGAYGRTADYRAYFSAPNSSFPFSGEVQPERISEAELGLDAMLFRRVWVDATWYRQRSDDALTCCLYTTPVANGAWHTTGLDAALSADIIKSLDVAWSARLTMSFLANRLDDDGQGNRNQAVGPVLVPRVRVRNVVGHPVAGFWGNPTRTHDDNGDGIITPAEVDLLPDSVFLGSSTPTRELGLTSTVALRRVSMSVSLDYRAGFRQLNGTAALRCDFAICGALYDPKAGLDEQTRAISLDRAGAGFVEDASFFRLRELGVTWNLVPGWASRHGFAGLSTTLIARNVLTFTGYSGFDPETNYRGQTGLGTGDLYTLPLPRSVALRFDVVR